MIFGGVAAVCAFGFYRFGQGHNEKRSASSTAPESVLHLLTNDPGGWESTESSKGKTPGAEFTWCP